MSADYGITQNWMGVTYAVRASAEKGTTEIWRPETEELLLTVRKVVPKDLAEEFMVAYFTGRDHGEGIGRLKTQASIRAALGIER